MKKSSGFLHFIATFSIIVLLVSAMFFGYSLLNIKNIKSLESENIKLNEEVANLIKDLNNKEVEFENLNREFMEKSEEFSKEYGYDLKDNKENELTNEIENIKNNNSLIKKQIASEIKKYLSYFDGDYYEDNEFENLVSNILSINRIDEIEGLNANLIDEIDTKAFLDKAKKSGTIKYLSSINENSRKNDILMLMTLVYTKELHEIGKDLSDVDDNLIILYTKALAAEEIYKNIEKMGLNVGKLSYTKFSAIRNSIKDLSNSYYKNKGIIEALMEEN